jgi:hypothetical protein
MRIKAVSLIGALWALLMLSGCLRPAERAGRRVDRLTAKFPQLLDTVVTEHRDTVIKYDSVFIDGIILDTFVNIVKDSIFVIQEGKVRTEVQVVTKERIKIRTEVEADTLVLRDTIIRERIKVVEKIKVPEPKRQRFELALVGVGFFIAFALLVLVKFS